MPSSILMTAGLWTRPGRGLTLGREPEGLAVTEVQWIASTDLTGMLDSLPYSWRQRKLRLFGAACARTVWATLTTAALRKMVEVTEEEADEPAEPLERWERSQTAAATAYHGRHPFKAAAWRVTTAREWVSAVAEGVLEAAEALAWTEMARTLPNTEWVAEFPGLRDSARIRARVRLCDILRDTFNPFRPVAVQPGWLAPAVTSLAQAAYEERLMPSGELDRDRLMVLADALEEAGCTEAELLGHLRELGPHVRGCWAVDLILGKG